MSPLSQSVQLLYAELLQQCATALPGHRGVSFSRKTVKGKTYWYLEVVIGSGKKQYSLGPDSDELRNRIEQQKALFRKTAGDAREREKLVSMLIHGGLPPIDNAEGRVLELLAQAGLFLSGGVLVGSHAFSAYQGMLGISWSTRLTQTHDRDLASEANLNIAIKEDAPDVRTTILDSGLGFFEIPALNPRSGAKACMSIC